MTGDCACNPPGCCQWPFSSGESMSNTGKVRYERGVNGEFTIVLLVDELTVARSQSTINIAAEVALRGLASLDFHESLVVSVPTNAHMVMLACRALPVGVELATTVELITACCW
jgi:hypothetical protein